MFGQRNDALVQTLVQIPPQRAAAFGLLGMLADKALGLGRGEEAEKLLAPQLEELLSAVEGGRRFDVTTVERACEFALRIAGLTGNAVWLNHVFRFYRALGRLPPSSVVDELIAVATAGGVKQPNVGGSSGATSAVLRESERRV